MQILIMEDDVPLATFLQRGLVVEGHEVRVAEDGKSGLQLAAGGSFDLIVLDLSLPQMDGMEVLRELRNHLHDASILVLTGRAALSDRVTCLDLGADDYLMKPFCFSELAARCRALLRRRERFADPVLRHGELELHRMERSVVLRGRAVDLTVKEFALLEYLMLARGRTCSRGELLREVWQMPTDAGTNIVDVYVNYLRKKLCRRADEQTQGGRAEAEHGSVVETVRGEGYCVGRSGMDGMKKPAAPVPAAAGSEVLPLRRGMSTSDYARLPRGLGMVANA